jgi:hypothetical protein
MALRFELAPRWRVRGRATSLFRARHPQNQDSRIQVEQIPADAGYLH